MLAITICSSVIVFRYPDATRKILPGTEWATATALLALVALMGFWYEGLRETEGMPRLRVGFNNVLVSCTWVFAFLTLASVIHERHASTDYLLVVIGAFALLLVITGGLSAFFNRRDRHQRAKKESDSGDAPSALTSLIGAALFLLLFLGARRR